MKQNWTIDDNLIFRIPLLHQKKSISIDEVVTLSKDKLIQEAVYLASPSLYREMRKLAEGRMQSKKDKHKTLSSLYTYFKRMHNRSTPFGLFSGCMVGEWSDCNDLNKIIPRKVERSTKLDMYYLCELTRKIEQNIEIRNRIKYYLNSTICIKSQTIQYVNYEYRNGGRKHFLDSVEGNIYLKYLLSRISHGATLEECHKLLAEFDSDLLSDEIDEYLAELVSQKLLVSEIEVNLVGVPYFDRLLSILASHVKSSPEIRRIYDLLFLVKEKLLELNLDEYNEVSKYEEIISILKELDVDIDEKFIFHVDINKVSKEKLKLDSKYKEDILGVFEFLKKFHVPQSRTHFKRFAKKFKERYGSEEVALMEVMSYEEGLGYPVQNSKVESYLLKDIPRLIRSGKNETTISWNILSHKLHHILLGSKTESGFQAIDLADHFKELNSIQLTNDEGFPESFSFILKIIGQSHNSSDFNFELRGSGGTSATNLLGRFGSVNTEIQTILDKIALHESEMFDDDTIHAELSHIHGNRIINVLARPSFRKYEIPYLAFSTKGSKQTIRIDDLYLSLDSFGKFKIRSRSLNKYVRPYLSNAHNFLQSKHPIYRFLSEFNSFYQRKYIGFQWCGINNLYHHLPRVSFKNFVLSRAHWRLNKIQYQELLNGNKLNFDQWRTDWNIPTYFILKEADREFLVDSTSKLSIKVFLDKIKKKESILIEEYLFDKESCPLKDLAGESYNNEIIGTILNFNAKPEVKNNGLNQLTNINQPLIQKTYHPGSEWYYVKFYCGVERADDILANELGPLIKNLKRDGIIDNWFFVKYSDPEFHLRIRFHLTSQSNLSLLLMSLERLSKSLHVQKIVWKVQVDSYIRELERYGTNSIELCEQIFHVDSNYLIKAMTEYRDKSPDYKWKFALLSVDSLLKLFYKNSIKRNESIKQWIASYGNEFGLKHKQMTKALNNKYRSMRSFFDQFMYTKNEQYNKVYKLIDKRDEQLEPVVSELMKSYSLDPIKYDKIVLSLIHMHLNRWFKKNQRFQEFIVLFLLEKYNISVEKRNQSKQVSKLLV